MQRFLPLIFLTAMSAAPAVADDGMITIAESKPFVATSTAPQRTSEFIDIPKGQDKLQMTLTYYNGTATAPGFKQLQIQSPSMNYVTADSFQGKNSCSRDVTGDLTWGGNQIIIYAKGPKDATLNWRLTALKPSVTGITPQTVNTGGTVTISGTNLCPEPEDNIITINGKQVTCTSATSSQLTAKIPADTPSGSLVVTVKTAGLDAGDARVNVSATPYLSRLSATWIPVGGQCTIYGANFGTTPGQVSLYMGPVQCPINSVQPSQISFSIPAAFGGGPWGYNQPLHLSIDGVKARNTLFISSGDTVGY